MTTEEQQQQKQNKQIEAYLEKIYPVCSEITLGAVFGYTAGFFSKKFAQQAAYYVGGAFVALQVLQYKGWITMNYQKLKTDAITFLDVDQDGSFTTKDIKQLFKKYIAILGAKIPSSAGFLGHSDLLENTSQYSLPPTDNGQDLEQGEISDYDDVRSISASINKENLNKNNINNFLQDDNKKVIDMNYKIIQKLNYNQKINIIKIKFEGESFYKKQKLGNQSYKKQQNYDRYQQKNISKKITHDPHTVIYQKPVDKLTHIVGPKTMQKKDCIDKPLTIQEGNVLIETWKKSSFIDFNSWIQVSKASLEVDFTENKSLQDDKTPSGYACTMNLKFNQNKHGKLNDFLANGYGKSKKSAKMMATERLVTDLVQTGLIRLGLRDKKFWYKYDKLRKDEEKQKEQTLKLGKIFIDEKESKLKIAKRACKKMQDYLKEDKFLDALNELEMILDNKNIEWRELNFIWSYALAQQNLLQIKQIIEKISKYRYSKNKKPFGFGAEDEEELTSAQYVKKHHSEKVKQKLFQFYGLTRLENDNQYEYFDSYILNINDPDIRSGQIQTISEEEQDLQIVQDPFQKDLKDTLIAPPKDQMAFENSPIKQIDQKNLHFPGYIIRDPFQLQQDSLKEKEQIEKTQESIKANIQSQKEQDKIIDLISNIVETPESLRRLQDIQNESCNYNDGFVVHKKQFDNRTQLIDRQTLEELYESIVYSGDLSFSLQVSELIYSQLAIKDTDFLHQHAAEFYMQKKNGIFVQNLEKIYDVFSFNRPKAPNQDYQVNLNGTIEKIGGCYCFDSLIMRPSEPQEILETKLLKKCKTDVVEATHHIVEGDVIILTTFFQPSYEKPILKEQTSKLANYINTKAKNNKEQSHFIHSVTEFGNTIEYAFIASIKEITPDYNIKIQLINNFKACQQAFLDKKAIVEQGKANNRIWKITKLASRYENDKIEQGLLEFTTNPKSINNTLFHILLTPPTQSSEMIRKFSQQQSTDSIEHLRNQTSLNVAQAKAVKSAASQNLTLVQGPPGSGKTTLCIEIVIEWLRQSGKPVLITAENNQNVDILFNELIKANIKAVKLAPGFEEVADTHFKSQKLRTSDKLKQKRERLELTKILDSESQHERDTFLENEDFNEEYIDKDLIEKPFQQREYTVKKDQQDNNKEFQTPHNQRFMFLKKLLREAPVVVCKATAVQSDYLKGLTFYRVIIDEAHRVSETLALATVVKNCQKLVLVGDPMSPGVQVHSMFAASKGVYLSLFDKFLMQRIQPIVLSEQYRLKSALIEFPSQYFYKGLISTKAEDLDQTNLFGFKWPNIQLRSTFINVKGTEILVNNNIQNVKEIEVVIEILLQILKSQYIKTNQIVVLTTTEEQKRRLRTEITYQAKRFSQLFGLTIDEIYRITKHSLLIDIDTIDRVQFYDKDLVIFSAVRSNKHKGLGILKDPRILNRLLWSGSKGIISIGDMETLCEDPNWAEYIKWCKKHKLIQYYCK
ncbi:P-loop containing nucleoside triphosphate hydrolase [Pseudocohnilembus persalinus]|uniref:p-loop containing nucleoside triphosphate hydrolase n=1 Tax=Pseudocohnilembus persalinus TaxID=266149 RepID=A0A0V0QNM6_PSEPJ|nr:P-loop containing nucleoside triphosphate hydrolase [Pseudocohnilembus persalinus]|eukprot:KRX03858.1 P-loop containing nucleoside triphosphate hydrolase [Pseudocohnilembus persalinus]